MAERLPMETVIAFQQQNPKKAGGKSFTRYEAYKAATTVQQALDLGAVKGDIAHDHKSGFLTVAPGQQAAGGAAIPVEPPVAPKRVKKPPMVQPPRVQPPMVQPRTAMGHRRQRRGARGGGWLNGGEIKKY